MWILERKLKMSTSCNIFLPSDVIISNVVNVIGILLGQKKLGKI
jgi:hypothetical protein